MWVNEVELDREGRGGGDGMGWKPTNSLRGTARAARKRLANVLISCNCIDGLQGVVHRFERVGTNVAVLYYPAPQG